MRPDNDQRIYLNDGDPTVVYLKNVIDDPEIQVGEHTYYHDPFRDPRDFAKNNILYHYPGAGDQIIIGKYCSIACGAKLLCSIAHHSKRSLAYYPFPIIGEHWDLTMEDLHWERKGPTVIGNDVWLGYDCVIMPGVHIGDGAAVGTRSVVTRDVPPYTVVGGDPARPLYRRFDDATIEKLLALKWWDLPEEELRPLLPWLIRGDLESLLEQKFVSDTTRQILDRLRPTL